MKNKQKTIQSTKIICAMAMLSAISIICGKFLAFPVGNVLRFSFENMPIIFAGIAFGPIPAMLVGIVADLIGCILVGYEINPIVTAGAALIGLASGGASLLLKKQPLYLSVGVSVFSAHILGSVIIKTIGLSAFYSMPFGILMLWRLLNYVIVGALEGAIIFLLLSNKLVRGAISSLLRPERIKKTTKGDVSMTYDEAIEYIHSINWSFCKPGLERIGELCEKLSHPEKDLKFIHVAGTNGKGSFCSMLNSILMKAGYKVGLYTSPYILEFNERMRMNGKNITNGELAEITAYVRPIADSMADKPTEFELITAIAFEYFKRAGADVVILEAGMGGRLDSTNIIRNPLLSVITGIALDHTAYLGDTVEKIAGEKAGIIKDGAPVLFGGTDEVAKAVISKKAEELGSEFVSVSYDKLTVKSATLDGTVFDYGEHTDLKIKLLGLYQPKNASVVLEAVDVLKRGGMEISDVAVREGLLSAGWPARFEIISQEPLIIFDGAHNPEGISSAVASIAHYFGSDKVHILTGVLRDKDYLLIAKELSTVASHAVTITPDNPRALPAEEYAKTLSDCGIVSVASDSIENALATAIQFAKEQGAPLLCLGSLYTYVDIIKALNKINKENI